MNCELCGLITKNNTRFCSHVCSTTYHNKYIWESKKAGKCKKCEVSIENRRVYCDLCWKENIKRKDSKTSLTNNKYCSFCQIEKTEENTLFLNGKWGRACRNCDAKNKADRVNKFKKNCVSYKGGQCEVCGYSKCIAALEFHHKDPTQKDFSMAQKKTCKFDDKIMAELDKCAILCCNCHREEHTRLKAGKTSLLELKIVNEGPYVEI